MVDLSIAVVNYNGLDTILQLLHDIYTHTNTLSFQVYVIDNASADGSPASIRTKFPQVTLIESDTNRGYGGGNNMVLPMLDSRYHLVINPDVVIKDNILRQLVDYMDFHPDVALVTPRVLHTDGTEQHLPKRLPTIRYMFGGRFTRYFEKSRRIRAEYTRSDEQFTQPEEIEFCTGCFMLMRTHYFKELGGFDKDFFMYMEDADLSQRLGQKGRLMFYPGCAITHQWEKASAKSFRFLLIHLNSLRIYLRKQKNGRANRAQRGAV